MSIVCLNGALVPEAEALLPATDAGLLLGAGVFETLRAIHGVGFLLERHYARLSAGAERIGIPVPFHLETLEYYLRQLEEANLCDDGRLRVTLVRGRGGEEQNEPNFVIQLLPLAPQPPAFRTTCATAGRAPHSPLAGVKSTSYLDYLLLREAAWKQGCDEALLLDDRGRLLEGSASNVFFVKGREIRTPDARGGILRGITRDYLLEQLSAWGYAAHETSLTLADLEAADEVFCTNAVVGVMPVSHVEGKALPSGQPGSLTRELAAAYRKAQAEYVAAARSRD